MAAYTPNPLNDTQPEDSVFAATAAAEFRAMKTVLAAYAAGINYLGEWSAQVGACPKGAFVTHNNAMWMAKVLLANIATVEPTDLNSATWFKFVQLTPGGYVAKTGNTGSAQMPAGTIAQRDAVPAVGYTRWNSELGCNETWDGTFWIPDGWVELGTISTASGTGGTLAVPTWPNELVGLIEGVSLTVNDDWYFRVGTSGGIDSTNYKQNSLYINNVNSSTGTLRATGIFTESGATVLSSGLLRMLRFGDTWHYTVHEADHGVGGTILAAGHIALASPLTQIQIGLLSGAFDAGQVRFKAKR